MRVVRFLTIIGVSWFFGIPMLWIALPMLFGSIKVIPIHELPPFTGTGTPVYVRGHIAGRPMLANDGRELGFERVEVRKSRDMVPYTSCIPKRLRIEDDTATIEVDTSVSLDCRGLHKETGQMYLHTMPKAVEDLLVKDRFKDMPTNFDAQHKVFDIWCYAIYKEEQVLVYGCISNIDGRLTVTRPPQPGNLAAMFGAPQYVLLTTNEQALLSNQHQGGWVVLAFSMLVLVPGTLIALAQLRNPQGARITVE